MLHFWGLVGMEEKEELLSKYRNTIPAGKGRAGHGDSSSSYPWLSPLWVALPWPLLDALGMEGVL